MFSTYNILVVLMLQDFYIYKRDYEKDISIGFSLFGMLPKQTTGYR
jgi:hypothetical protein